MENMNNNFNVVNTSNQAQNGYTIQRPTQVKHANCDEVMNITSIADLQSYANGTVVRFPDFGEGQPFVARVRRPSMLALAKQGKIPNSLLGAAGDLFAKGGAGIDTDNQSMLNDMYEIMDIIATAALIEPTMEQIKNCGIEFSDDQVMAIFNYAQAGVKALESFREERGDTESTGDSERL